MCVCVCVCLCCTLRPLSISAVSFVVNMFFHACVCAGMCVQCILVRFISCPLTYEAYCVTLLPNYSVCVRVCVGVCVCVCLHAVCVCVTVYWIHWCPTSVTRCRSACSNLSLSLAVRARSYNCICIIFVCPAGPRALGSGVCACRVCVPAVCVRVCPRVLL